MERNGIKKKERKEERSSRINLVLYGCRVRSFRPLIRKAFLNHSLFPEREKNKKKKKRERKRQKSDLGYVRATTTKGNTLTGLSSSSPCTKSQSSVEWAVSDHIH